MVASNLSYKEKYVGLESIPCAMDDLKARKTCGRTIVIIDTQGDRGQGGAVEGINLTR